MHVIKFALPKFHDKIFDVDIDVLSSKIYNPFSL